MRHIVFLIGILFNSLLLAADSSFQIDLPINCEVGKDCFIQNYVDVHRDSQPNKPRDYKCGSLVYSGHKGTDFRVKTFKEMRKGVEVIASADGHVKGVRNDMREGLSIESDAIKGKECGNGIVIEHGNGWETQYCHMQEKSIKVSSGNAVKKGDVLGLVGMSGKTQFPHVHISVRKDGKIIDPFIGIVDKTTKCGGPLNSIWSKAAQEKILPYQSTDVLAAGFSNETPTQDTVMNGEHRKDTMSAKSDKLIFWVYLFGVRQGDEEEFILKDPESKIIFKKRIPSIKRDKAIWLSYVGKKMNSSLQPLGQENSEEKGWLHKVQQIFGYSSSIGEKKLKKGRYTGVYTLFRKDTSGVEKTVITVTRQVGLEA